MVAVLIVLLIVVVVVVFGEYVPDPSKLIPGPDGYVPVDYDDPDYYHCSELDTIPSGILYNACLGKAEGYTRNQDPYPVVDRELRRGANPNVYHFHTKVPVVTACVVRNFTQSVQHLVDRGANLSQVDPKGYSACHRAAFLGHVHILQLCHKQGVDLLALPTGGELKFHHLHLACMGNTWGHVESTKFLLEIGLDPDAKSIGDELTCMEQYANDPQVRQVLLDAGSKTTRRKKPKNDNSKEEL